MNKINGRLTRGRNGGSSAAADRRNDEAARELQAALAGRIEGELRFDGGSRALYATDHSIYRQVPIGVVIPRAEEDVIATVAACRERDVPILGRGCGTSLAGQTCNVAVVIDFSKYMNRILALDPEGKQAKVQPGLINDQLREAAMKHGLTFAPDPATHRYCTLGGNIGNNSCGAHTVMGGKTVDNVEELDILTYDGLRMRVGATSDDEFDLIQRAGGRRAEIYRELKALAERYGDRIRAGYPKIPRRVSGYNLDDLLPEKGFHVARSLVGSESTCALTLSATVRLIDFPAYRALMVLSYADAAAAADEVVQVREFGPIALEGFQHHVIENMHKKGKHLPGMKLLEKDGAYLLAEFGGDSQEEANGKVESAFAALRRMKTGASAMRLYEKPEEQGAIWEVRESGVGASRVPEEEEAWPSWEDAAVPPERLGDYLRDFDAMNKRYGYRYTLFGHFGDGCVHTRMTFGLKTADGVKKFREYMEEAADLCLRYGGSLSGEHGDGQAKGELLPKMFGPDLIQAFRDFKTIWDPHWRMNPGKVIDALPLDANLRLGPDYSPMPVTTYFKFPEDNHSFAHAAERCFGVGKCRELGGQTMCPSFQGTREEKYSTRGRARLLFEMMRGDAIKDGWRSKAVLDALDLCLQCKGCKGDCPVSVDMATYKAEFLAHHYKGRLRPRAAYSMGLIFLWSRMAMLAPGLVNGALRAPGMGPVLKRIAGFTTRREAPQFAAESFQDWWAKRASPRGNDKTLPEVILWPDTFNNYFLPGTAKAAVTVLEAAGYRVTVPLAKLCCGRPLYDFGMLDLAREKLRDILEELRPAIRAGTPVVGLEPSCLSVFRDEMPNILADDEDAQRLKRLVKTLPELLAETEGWAPPPLKRRAILQTHCHHKAVLNAEPQRKMLAAMGLDLQRPPAGCCGHAGAFGYEAQHYDVSQAIGEQVLLPAVRKADRETLIIADGFSCRQQIKDGTGRWAMHPAEVLAMALEAREAIPPEIPERRYLEPAAALDGRTVVAGLGAALALGLAAALAMGGGFRRTGRS
ncbi:MAG TPA: FAD-linked oxidase C-terminal domain-containing protein [Acetobacteraceae bacterium]|nr:FAD-linked oxidase C-terminal domain-containing protein [Acetobacteraceae bacterium]